MDITNGYLFKGCCTILVDDDEENSDHGDVEGEYKWDEAVECEAWLRTPEAQSVTPPAGVPMEETKPATDPTKPTTKPLAPTR